MKNIIFLTVLVFAIPGYAKKLICEKTENGQGQKIVEKKSEEITAQGAFISFISKLDSKIKLDGYYDLTHKMMGAHINDYTTQTSSGSYADLEKEKPSVKVNYRKQTSQGIHLFVLECLEK